MLVHTMDSTTDEVIQVNRTHKIKYRRDLIGFWFLGLCNNFGYVIMLSAAYDILSTQEDKNATQTKSNSTTVSPDTRICNQMSTGAILLADVLPTLFIKLTAAFYIHRIHYRIRVPVAILFAAASFLIVAFSTDVWMSLFGVVCASISSGLGELTFLSLTSLYHRNTISTWSSGTGGAGLFGALSYAGLTGIGLSPQHTILVMLIVPVIMTTSYYVILTSPEEGPEQRGDESPLLRHEETPQVLPTAEETNRVHDDSDDSIKPDRNSGYSDYVRKLSTLQRLKLIVPLLKYMIPLFLVYVAEYYINQALFELVNFRSINWLTINEQYRWYQADYQLGVFVSRSSVNCFHTKKIWIFPIFQLLNAILFTFDAIYLFVPFWLVCCIIFFEGLLGGAAYVNSFVTISEETKEEVREFSLGVASVADTLGVCLAGFVSIPVHNKICSMPLYG